MSNVERYLHQLVGEIGPRPAASDTERSAAEWIQSVFYQSGAEARIVDIDVPVSTAVSRGIAHLLVVVGVVVVGLVDGAVWLDWLAWGILAAVGLCVFVEASGRRCPISISKKGPSQNVVARYAPNARHGERLRKIVVVARYDSALVPPLLNAATASAYAVLRRAGRYYAYIAPLLGLLLVLPISATDSIERWVWYLMLSGAIIPVLLSVNFLLQPVLKRFSLGANTNASGVAAMLAVLDELVGTPDAVETEHPAEVADDFGWFSPGSAFQPAATPPAPATAATPQPVAVAPVTPDSLWGEPSMPVGLSAFADEDEDALLADVAAGPIPSPEPAMAPAAAVPPRPPVAASSGGPRIRTGRTPSLGTVEFAAVPEDRQQTVSFSPVSTPVPTAEGVPAFSPDDVLGPDVVGGASTGAFTLSDFAVTEEKRSLLGFLKRGKRADRRGASGAGRSSAAAAGVQPDEPVGLEWLGMSDFDARSAGQDIGSWDNYQEGDESGWKGGSAGGDPIEDPSYADEQAARIRRKVSEHTSSDIEGKEVWFVATGAGAEGNAGMREFIATQGDDLRGAIFINIDSVGSGNLHWYQREGLGFGVAPNPRLMNLARRAAKATGILAKGARGRDVVTDATVALKARHKAITITRLDASGLHGGGGCLSDTLESVDPRAVAEAAHLVTQMIREV